MIAHATTRPDRFLARPSGRGGAAPGQGLAARAPAAMPRGCDACASRPVACARCSRSRRPARPPGIRRARRDLKTIGRALGRVARIAVARDDLARAARAHGWARGDVAAVEALARSRTLSKPTARVAGAFGRSMFEALMASSCRARGPMPARARRTSVGDARAPGRRGGAGPCGMWPGL